MIFGHKLTSDTCYFVQLLFILFFVYFRIVGTFTLILQQLIQDGEIKVCEPLVDINNRILDVSIL